MTFPQTKIWNKTTRKMIPVHRIIYGDDPHDVTFENITTHDDGATTVRRYTQDIDNIIIIQGTGYTDANNRPIMDGDIVQPLCNPDEKILVEWSSDLLAFTTIDEMGDRVFHDDGYSIHNTVVIGNMFENQDLMED